MRNDTGAGSDLAIESAGTLRRDAGHELGLTDRRHRLCGVSVVHRAALDEDRLANVEVGSVLEQLVEKIAQTGTMGSHIPEVMMRVDDLLSGVDCGLLLVLAKRSIG